MVHYKKNIPLPHPLLYHFPSRYFDLMSLTFWILIRPPCIRPCRQKPEAVKSGMPFISSFTETTFDFNSKTRNSDDSRFNSTGSPASGCHNLLVLMIFHVLTISSSSFYFCLKNYANLITETPPSTTGISNTRPAREESNVARKCQEKSQFFKDLKILPIFR